MSKSLRFVLVPKISHPWCDEVRRGAQLQADTLAKRLGIEIVIDYMPPSTVDAVVQNGILEQAAIGRPDGIAIDPVDAVTHIAALQAVASQGIPVVLFDSPSPSAAFPSVGNDFAEQGTIAAERLVELIGRQGKVAVMKGFPSAPNHKERYDAQIALLQKYSGITIVDGGTDNDDIELAREQAASVLALHPDLVGYLCCDASGPIGIASAIRQAGKVGEVKFVSMDGIRPILEAIRDGVIDSSSATKPRMQGSMAVLLLWQSALGMQLPRSIDTGIDLITRENVGDYLRDANR